MKFRYDDGTTIDITKEVFVQLSQEMAAIMVAYTVEMYGLSLSDKQTLRLVNRVMQRTWNNHEWLEKMIGFMYKKAKEIDDGRDTNPSC